MNMSERKERRYSPRYQLSQGTVACEENTSFGLFRKFTSPYQLNDLNKSGLGFKTDKSYSYGDTVRLKIDIPGNQKIQVIGEVRWISDNWIDNYRNVGIQFLPFGTMKGYNSFAAREKLEKVISPLENRLRPDEEILH